MKKGIIFKSIFMILVMFIYVNSMEVFGATNAPNLPVVINGLTPIKYQNNSWVKVINTETNPWYNDKEWYDYENGVWANAGIDINSDDKYDENDIFYVWIPRFTYKIENEAISIKWSDGKIDDTTDGYLRHPAFYFGEYIGGDTLSNANFIERNNDRNELTGFWIQKDLFSENVTDIGAAFDDAIKMTSNVDYGLPQSGAYTHMTKASEWGAFSYLTAAKGSKLNETKVNLGSVMEYVAGIKGSPSGSATILTSNYKKYRDLINEDLSNYYGYALTETAFLTEDIVSPSSNSFLVRGGALGLFGYTSGSGQDSGKGYRTCISIVSEELTDTIAFFDTETSVVAGDYLILGVDFSVDTSWKFPEDPANFFEVSENAGGKAVVDIDCIYEGSTKWRQDNLNAEVIKMIKPDMSQILAEDISSGTTYPSGKYTLIVRVGGRIGNDPVIKVINDMDTKIVVNEINLISSADEELIKIGNIPNNKVRLNIFGESASTAVSRVVLTNVPDENTEYDLEEELRLNGVTIVPYLGELAGEEINITIDNVVNPNITNTPGNNVLVELIYQGIPVIQDEVEFRIDVSSTRQLTVTGVVKLGNNTLNSQILAGPGKYSRKDSNITQDLIAYEYLNGYLFSSWDSTSSYVLAADDSDYSTTFIIPKRSTDIGSDDVTITANYIAPSSLLLTNHKTEFIVGEDFSLGLNGTLHAVYRKGSTEIKKALTLDTYGVKVTIKDSSSKECSLNDLQFGKYTVTIEYAGKAYPYTIDVVNAKYGLEVYTNSISAGTVTGDILYGNEVKDTLTLDEDIGGIYKPVSYDNTVKLTAVPSEGYDLLKWTVTGKDDLVSADSLMLKELTFTMPQKDIRIEAEFARAYNIKFKIKDGQEAYGRFVESVTEQTVRAGFASTPVKVEATNENYTFVNWVDGDGNVISNEPELTIVSVMEDKTYIAVFDNIWTVEFYSDTTSTTPFAIVKVVNGGDASIADIPTKEGGYVFTGWTEDISGENEANLSMITSNLKVYAQYVPRIAIDIDETAEAGNIAAQITGTMIEDGTLQYMISDSPDNTDGNFASYTWDGIFTGFDSENTWENLEGIYRTVTTEANKDSSSVITITSNNATEVVKFEYILEASEDSQLGITINGVKKVTPSVEILEGWNSFEEEVPVVNGTIKIGISYSQGEENYTGTDYAAIRNLAVTRRWTIIPNEYYLFIPTEFGENYIHVKGTGSDDATVYKKVSECISGNV